MCFTGQTTLPSVLVWFGDWFCFVLFWGGFLFVCLGWGFFEKGMLWKRLKRLQV